MKPVRRSDVYLPTPPRLLEPKWWQLPTYPKDRIEIDGSPSSVLEGYTHARYPRASYRVTRSAHGKSWVRVPSTAARRLRCWKWYRRLGEWCVHQVWSLERCAHVQPGCSRDETIAIHQHATANHRAMSDECIKISTCDACTML